MTPLRFLEAALPKLPDFVTNEVVSHWRTGRYIAWICAALWFALPIAVTHVLRSG
ncbi:MAG: hypothetical protein HY651_09585 [Acidobacteria bacterium]|nr:hypothetical protein [Acidobacteriota bacterium]